MSRRIHLITLILLFGIFTAASAQDCTATITVGGTSTGPCVGNRLSFPVYITNPCEAGGFSIQVQVTDPSWFKFDPGDSLAADTIGACHTNWGSFDFNVHQYGHMVTVTALGPGGENLPPSDSCLLFTVHGDFDNLNVADTCQLIRLGGNSSVSDSTGYSNYNVNLRADSLCITECDSNLIRGDANNSGTLNGLDVIYLVAYLKGNASICQGCPCPGDANHSGDVNGLDVTYLIAYFKYGGALDPCD